MSASRLEYIPERFALDVPDSGDAVPSPLHVDSRETIRNLQQATVETLGGDSIEMTDVLAGKVLLVLMDNRATMRLRTSAEIAWIEERLDPDVRFVMVWPSRPVRIRSLSPLRPWSISVIDTDGSLGEVLASAGKRRSLLVDMEAGTVAWASEESDIFSLGREIRDADTRGSDRVIALGDLM